MTSEEAFAFLKQEANRELQAVQEQGAAQLVHGNLAEARRALDHAEQVKGLLASLEDLKQRWKLLPAPGVVAVPPVSPALPSHKPGKRGIYGRLEVGHKNPQADYYIPILRVLVEMGGRGQVEQVLKRVGELVESRLTAEDRLQLPRGGDLRWRNTAQWARFDLKEMGYLSANSPRGVWEITPAGRAYFEQHRR
jgi:restriction system protein